MLSMQQLSEQQNIWS